MTKTARNVGSMAKENKQRFTCLECEKSFSRAEHLTRHQALHDGSQGYSCDRCSKTFPRKDALTRHVLTHDGGPNLLERKGRACRPCAKSKVRCSGELPCSRCNHKSLECEFPDPRPQHSKAASSATELPSPESDDISGPVMQNDDHQSSIASRGLPSPDLIRQHRESVSSIAQSVIHRGSFAGERRFNPEYWSPTVLSTINWLPTASRSPTGFESIMNPPLRSPTFTYQPPTPEGQPPVVTADQLEHSSTTGEFYIDGNAGRLPRVKRQRTMPRRQSEIRSRDNGYRLSWNPTFSHDGFASQHFADFEYEAMQNSFLTLCVNCAPITTPFMSVEFPSIEIFNYLIHLFFTHLHPTIPFVHRPTFNPDHEGRWILLLAMSSAACWFIEDESSDDLAEGLLEFLRRVTLHFDLTNAWQRTFTNCRHAQIRLLFMISASGSRHESVKAWTDRAMSELCFLVNYAICQSYPNGQYTNAGMPSSAEWLIWSEDEQTRRTAFLVWMFGFLRFAQHSDGRVPITLDAISPLRLPCNDAMFEARDPEVWQQLEAQAPRITLLEALEHLYIDKQVLDNLGDFSLILLIYGVVQRTREVQDYVQQPLSRFEPVAERRNSREMSKQPVWAANVPLFTRWRNAACDCLDIIHFQCNAVSKAAGGFESPTLLHLHMSRVLMLSPLDQLLRLARMINIPYASSAETGRCSPEETEMKRRIQQWAVHDQYKARLAAIHAGVTFWHVRRFSTNAYYEPFAVLAATLTLWALSACWSNANRQQRSYGQESDPEGCEIILIDRPTDDELVQAFVRKGQDMKALMTGVEDGLWAPLAPYSILREGSRLLARLQAWPGEVERAINLLEGLAMARF